MVDISSISDTATAKTKDGIAALMETDTVQLQDGSMALGLGIGGIGVSAAASGDIFMGTLAGLQGVAYTGASITMGDYPGRATLPFHRARKKGRGMIYDRFIEEKIRDNIEVGPIDEQYPDIDLNEELMQEYSADTPETAHASLADDIVEQARDRYVANPASLDTDPEPLLTEMVEDAIPDFRLSDDTELLYTNDDIHPYGIKDELIDRFGAFLQDELTGQREERINEGLGVIDGSYPLVDEYLDTIHDDAWDGEVESRDDLYDAVLNDMVFQGRSVAITKDNPFQDELEGRYNAATRFDETAALDQLDDHDYQIYQVDDPEVIATINTELGTCERGNSKNYRKFQEWAWEDGTTILGVRRDDSDDWVGFTRNYSFKTPEGDDVLAVDTWEIPYKDNKKGHHPDDGCDFANYGDVLPVEALASIQYGLDNDYDFVVAGSSDGRVGDARQVNPGRDTSLHLKGLDQVNKHYGLGLTTEQTVHVLMEDEFSDYRG